VKCESYTSNKGTEVRWVETQALNVPNCQTPVDGTRN